MDEERFVDLLMSGLFFSAFTLVVGYNLLLVLAWKRLRTSHPSVWESLGRPSIFNIDPRVVTSARRYLWSGKSKELGDIKLLSLSKWSKICGYFGAGLFMAIGLIALASVFYVYA